MMTAAGYVHGYSGRESCRLGDQADTLEDLLHAGTAYPAGSRVLEVGCGVGAQTVHLRLQSTAGGNALIGRQLQPLLAAAGYHDVVVHPRTIYADGSRPGMVDGFTRNTFTAMIESVRDDALAAGLISRTD